MRGDDVARGPVKLKVGKWQLICDRTRKLPPKLMRDAIPGVKGRLEALEDAFDI